MPPADAQGNLHGTDGRFQTKANDEAPELELTAPADDYWLTINQEMFEGADIDDIAHRDGWTAATWEKYYEANGSDRDSCADCGRTLDGTNSSSDGLCLPCAYPDEYAMCGRCSMLATYGSDNRLTHVHGDEHDHDAIDEVDWENEQLARSDRWSVTGERGTRVYIAASADAAIAQHKRLFPDEPAWHARKALPDTPAVATIPAPPAAADFQAAWDAVHDKEPISA